jgi:hypothetical protein
MIKTYTKDEFLKLDFDTRGAIIEQLMPDEFYNGQEKIGFWIPENYSGEIGVPLPPTPPEIEAEEEKKFNELINELSLKLFYNNPTITCDLEIEEN